MLVKNPSIGKALKGKLQGSYSLRVSDYRIINDTNSNILHTESQCHRRTHTLFTINNNITAKRVHNFLDYT